MFGSHLDFFGVFRRRERMLNNEETRKRLKEFERQIASGAADINSFFMKKDKVFEKILSQRMIPGSRGAKAWEGLLRPAVERMASMGRRDGYKRLRGALSGSQRLESETLFQNYAPPEPAPPDMPVAGTP